MMLTPWVEWVPVALSRVAASPTTHTAYHHHRCHYIPPLPPPHPRPCVSPVMFRKAQSGKCRVEERVRIFRAAAMRRTLPYSIRSYNGQSAKQAGRDKDR
ncbi:hypothetical protein BZA05DRAFT_385218 [Tricharina praecox]|uniref:uncharacterized protein n=1 Tax=Tricharina praecox TaxID=43433 RepID=UPI0022212838|nr:uncharacterized protein BZA05DRAFT_385218 [Tricharina praecox]KAI5857903.1 hypothetical protein BZA05DRAFT_385218 [Tricharina praecox]